MVSYTDKSEQLRKELEQEIKYADGKLTEKLQDKLKKKIQKILFVEYIELTKKGKAFDLAKVSKQIEIYKQKNPKKTKLSFHDIEKDYTDYSDLFGVITKPEQFNVSDYDVNYIFNNPINILKYINSLKDNLAETNKEYYFEHKDNNSDISTRHQSLKDIQKLIKFSKLSNSTKYMQSKMKKDKGFKAGIEKLKFSTTLLKSEKEENKIYKQIDNAR